MVNNPRLKYEWSFCWYWWIVVHHDAICKISKNNSRSFLCAVKKCHHELFLSFLLHVYFFGGMYHDLNYFYELQRSAISKVLSKALFKPQKEAGRFWASTANSNSRAKVNKKFNFVTKADHTEQRDITQNKCYGLILYKPEFSPLKQYNRLILFSKSGPQGGIYI